MVMIYCFNCHKRRNCLNISDHFSLRINYYVALLELFFFRLSKRACWNMLILYIFSKIMISTLRHNRSCFHSIRDALSSSTVLMINGSLGFHLLRELYRIQYFFTDS